MKRLFWLLALISVMGCAHHDEVGSTYYLGPYDQNNRAPAAAYAADGFMIQKKLTHRPKRPQHPYFHKSCELVRNTRSYTCTSLPWVSDPLGYY